MKEFVSYEDYEKMFSDGPYLIIGVAGHLDMIAEEKALLTTRLKEKAIALRGVSEQKLFVLFSGFTRDTVAWIATLLEPARGDRYVFVETRTEQEIGLDPAKTIAQSMELGTFLSRYCTHLLALWDGVEEGSQRGVSAVVRIYLNGKYPRAGRLPASATERTLHQLVVRRNSNYFPTGRRFHESQLHLPPGEIHEWVVTGVVIPGRLSLARKIKDGFRRYTSWICIGGALFGTLLLVDILTGFRTEDLFQIVPLMVFYYLAWLLYRRYPSSRLVLLRFVYPMAIAFVVIVLGFVGFMTIGGATPDIGDALFSAARLITLDSVWKTHGLVNCSEVPVALEIARALGGFLAGYSFVLAFSLAIGREGLNRLLFWFHRNFFSAKGFVVVAGDGEMALDMALDLEKRGLHVVILDEGRDSRVGDVLRTSNVWYFKGNITSKTAIKKTYFDKAHAVYIMSETDEENFRTLQEMDEMMPRQPGPCANWYVHVHDQRMRGLVHQLSRRKEQLHTFSIYANTARRLLTRFPVDRFAGPLQNGMNDSQVSQIVILGFGKMAREIALTSLRSGRYPGNRHLLVKVYYPTEDQDLVNGFVSDHPEFFVKNDVFAKSPYFVRAQNYTFFKDLPPDQSPVSFELLPDSESALRSPFFSFYELIRSGDCFTVYACLESGIESARILGIILPRIGWLKKTMDGKLDAQIFCFYNFPDEKEEAYVETQLNAVAPFLPIHCFGNFIYECSSTAISNVEMNKIAKRLALLYACLYGSDVIDPQIPELANFSHAAEVFRMNYMSTQTHHVLPDQIAQEAKNRSLIFKAQKVLAYLDDFHPTQIDNWADQVWRNILEDERESNIQAADHAWVKFRQTGKRYDAIPDPAAFWTPEELELLGELEHRRWNAEKLTLGWLPFADGGLWEKNKKDFKAQKYHHHLVPFDHLPPAERNKDHTQVLGLPYFFKPKKI